MESLSNVVEIQQVHDYRQANELLAAGYWLLSVLQESYVTQRRDGQGFYVRSKVAYVLGKGSDPIYIQNKTNDAAYPSIAPDVASALVTEEAE